MTASQKRLILHIGLGKTGTSVLQQFLAANRDVLAGFGIAYPDYGRVDNAHHLLSPHVPHYMMERWEFKNLQQWTARLGQTGYDQTLLSSEIMSSASRSELARYFEVVREVFSPRVIVYLRRQDLMIASIYNQQVKAGRQKRPVDAILERQVASHDYLQKLQPWEDILGRDALVVRAYEPAQLYRGDIRHDFLRNVFGIEIDERFVLPTQDPNPAFPAELLEFKRALNWIVKERVLHRRCNRALQRYAAMNPVWRSDTYRLSEEQQAQVLASVAPSNAQLAQRYNLVQPTLFLPQARDSVEPDARRGGFAADTADIAGFIDACDAELGEHLRQLLKEQPVNVGPYHLQAVEMLSAALGVTR